jgi:CelD/BcsL family acetyltransferase involved in cellulose biosynthesis
MQMRSKYFKNAGKHFELTTVKSIGEIEQIRPIWEEMQANEPSPQINADIDRYLSVLKASNDDLQPYILLVKENGQPIAMLIGRIQKTHVKCEIGRKTLFEPVLKEVCVVYGGLIGKDTDEICSLLVREVMRVLASGQADMVSFNHVRTDCPLYKFARKIPGLFYRSHFPKIERHWTMSVPENIDVFYQARSKKHRSHLRQYGWKLERTYNKQVRVVTYFKEDEVEQAIGTAAEISRKTYQRAFGAGIVDDPKTLALFSDAARRGWLQTDIMFVGDDAVAFQIGLKYRRVYNLHLIGFDPVYRRFNVGTLLFVEVLERLSGDAGIETIDFGFSDADYKRSYGNQQCDEACLYIVAGRVFPVFVNLVKSLTLGISLLAQYLVTKLGILNLVQRYRRRHVLRKSLKAEGRAAADGGEEKWDP